MPWKFEPRMNPRKWQLLTTLFDMPSAEALSSMLASEGITVRVVSEAHLFGQAAPCRLFVDAAQVHQARWTLSQRQFSDEELTLMAGSETGGEEGVQQSAGESVGESAGQPPAPGPRQ